MWARLWSECCRKKKRLADEEYVHPGERPGSDWGVTRAEWDENPLLALKKAFNTAMCTYKDGPIIVNVPLTEYEARKSLGAAPLLDAGYLGNKFCGQRLCYGDNQIVFNSAHWDAVQIFKKALQDEIDKERESFNRIFSRFGIRAPVPHSLVEALVNSSTLTR